MVGRKLVGLVLALASAAAVACESSEGSDYGSGTPDGGRRDGSNGNDGDGCQLDTTLSGGVDAKLGDESYACAYTSRSVTFGAVVSDVAVAINLSVDELDPGETGSFAATIDISHESELWRGATCTVNIESNVLTERAAPDAGVLFDSHLVKGTGSCATPANFAGTAGGKAPIAIAPFTFAAPMLFY